MSVVWDATTAREPNVCETGEQSGIHTDWYDS